MALKQNVIKKFDYHSISLLWKSIEIRNLMANLSAISDVLKPDSLSQCAEARSRVYIRKSPFTFGIFLKREKKAIGGVSGLGLGLPKRLLSGFTVTLWHILALQHTFVEAVFLRPPQPRKRAEENGRRTSSYFSDFVLKTPSHRQKMAYSGPAVLVGQS